MKRNCRPCAEFRATEHLLAVLPAAEAKRHQEAIDKVHAQAAPHLHVVGPTSLQAGAKGNLHVTTRHPEGNVIPAGVRIKLADAQTGDVVKVVRLQTDETGHARAEIDAAGAKPNSKLKLTVEADIGFALASVQETLRVHAPSFVTRIDTNKSIYQVKDVLFFRALVLDRHSLQPPTQPIPMHVELQHGKTIVRSLDQDTGRRRHPGGGIRRRRQVRRRGLRPERAPGRFRSGDVQSATARIEVVRALPGIRLDPNPYFAGGMVTGELVLPGGPAPIPGQIAGMINGKPVPVTLQPQSQPTMQAFGAANIAPAAPRQWEARARRRRTGRRISTRRQPMRRGRCIDSRPPCRRICPGEPIRCNSRCRFLTPARSKSCARCAAHAD